MPEANISEGRVRSILRMDRLCFGKIRFDWLRFIGDFSYSGHENIDCDWSRSGVRPTQWAASDRNWVVGGATRMDSSNKDIGCKL
jgi:hypothetical protein